MLHVSQVRFYTIYFLESGKLYCWGFNFYEQLGLGDSERDFSKPVRVQKLVQQKVRQVSCGYFHTGALV